MREEKLHDLYGLILTVLKENSSCTSKLLAEKVLDDCCDMLETYFIHFGEVGDSS